MKTVYNITESSNISLVVANSEKRNLIITFKNGKRYKYESVTKFDYEAFIGDITQGNSVGKSFAKYIRPKYAGKKLEEES